LSRADRWRFVLFVALAVATAVLAVRVARQLEIGGRLRLEVGRLRITELEPATLERLATLDAQVNATYYVSARERMPSHMRRVERQVTDLLESLAAAAPDRFAYRVVDPEADEDRAGFAARRRVAPFRERSVAHDSWSERTVYSALTLAYGTRREAVIDGIGPDELSRLQAAIVAHLDQMERPRRPVLALAAPGSSPGTSPGSSGGTSGAGFDELADLLATRGELVAADLDGGGGIPPEADVLFWMAPRRVEPATLEALDRFLDSGRSVVVAGSLFAPGAAGLSELDGAPALELAPSGFPAEALHSHLGLAPTAALLCDARSEELLVQGEPRAAPFLVRCIAPNQNFRLWGTQPNGTLLFASATPITLDAERLFDRGWRATVLATTSDDSWLQDPPLEAPLPLARMRPEEGIPVAKQILMAELRPDDPWRGRVVVCAATTPFEDGLLSRPNTAHRNLVRTLLDEPASPERLVIADADLERPEPLPPQGSLARVLWRGFGVFLLPAALVVIALATGRRRAPGRAERPSGGPAPGRGRGGRRWALPLALLLSLGAARGLAELPLWVDATSEGANRLSAEARAIARRASADAPIQVEVVVSPRWKLPPELRPARDRLEGTLAAFARAAPGIAIRSVDPDSLAAGERDRLANEGIQPIRAVTRDEEVTTVRSVWSALRLSRGEASAVVPLSDAAAYEEAELRIAFALWKLGSGRAPHVAFASDVPRLSAAEAHEQFQTQGLFAPGGVDVYSLARARLRALGFRVTHVNPREPELPEDADVLVWMQPRRSIEKMLSAAVRELVGGGKLLLAAQHFNIQSRQYRGADFDVVYWPQPQSPDVEELYFPEVGIELVREVLFDRLSTAIVTDTQVTGRRSGRDFERQASALPFLLRASAANFAADSTVTSGLSDQAFLWSSFLRWDDERLARSGIEARPLITTSPQAWSYDWSGGWIPPELLEGPADEDGRLGRVPLAAHFRGTFPAPRGALSLGPPREGEEEAAPDWPEAGAEGELLFFACSELFKDEHFGNEEFRADQLLVSAVATLALPDDLAAVAAHRRSSRGLDWVEPDERLRWRAAVVGAGPLALVALGAILGLARRQRSPAPPDRPRPPRDGGPRP